MTDNELLLAISNIVQTHIEPLKVGMEELKQDVQELQARVGRVEQRLDKVEQRLDKVEQRLDKVEQRLDKVEQRLDKVEQRLDDLERRFDDQEQRIWRLEQAQQRTNLLLENDIIPRLQTIEACYTSTYYRYVEEIEDIGRMKEDLSILKKVVAEHSEKLKKIS